MPGQSGHKCEGDDESGQRIIDNDSCSLAPCIAGILNIAEKKDIPTKRVNSRFAFASPQNPNVSSL